MGGAWDSIKGGFSPTMDPNQSLPVDGENQTVGDLRKGGYNDDEITALGGKKNVPGQTQLAIGDAFKQGLTNYGNARGQIDRQRFTGGY